jgi:hypothetical protein
VSPACALSKVDARPARLDLRGRKRTKLPVIVVLEEAVSTVFTTKQKGDPQLKDPGS